MYNEDPACDNLMCADNIMGICAVWEQYDMDTYGCEDHFIDNDI